MADIITLEGLDVRCIIGIHARERIYPQLLTARLLIELDGHVAAESARLSDTLDYSLVSALVRFVLEAGRFLLVETAAEVIAATVLGATAGIQPSAVTVELTKPAALPGATIIRYAARRVATHRTWVNHLYGKCCTLFDAPSCRLMRLELNPQGVLSRDQGMEAPGAVLALSDGIQTLPAGFARFFGVDRASDDLHNVGTSICSLLLIVPGPDAELLASTPEAPVDFFARAGHDIVMAGC